MKKAVSLLIMSALLAYGAYAQSAFEEKKYVLQGGIGISPLGLFGTTQGLPLSMSFDYGISKDISVGIYLGWHSSREVWFEASPPLEESGINYGYATVAARAAYHVDFFGSKKIDTYGIVSVGYCIVSVSTFGFWEGVKAKGNFLAYGVGGGIRYFFTPNIGVFGEAGYGGGIDLIGFGLSFKF